MKKLKLFLIGFLLLTVYNAVGQYQGAYNYGDTIRITVIPEPGWELEGWYHGDEIIGSDYTLEYVVTDDMNIVAKMRRIQVIIDVIVDPPGSGTVTGAGLYDPGDEVYLLIEPNSGYIFNSLMISGYEVPNPYRFEATVDVLAYANMDKKHEALKIIGIFILAIISIFLFFNRKKYIK